MVSLHTRPIGVLIAVVTVFVLSASPAFALVKLEGPIVPCGIGGSPKCTICHIPILFKNLIEYMTFYVALPIAFIMFAVAGFYFVVSGGSPQKINQAKSVLIATVIGVGIVFLSWLLIGTLMNILTPEKTGFRGLKKKVLPWNSVEIDTSNALCQ